LSTVVTSDLVESVRSRFSSGGDLDRCHPAHWISYRVDIGPARSSTRLGQGRSRGEENVMDGSTRPGRARRSLRFALVAVTLGLAVVVLPVGVATAVPVSRQESLGAPPGPSLPIDGKESGGEREGKVTLGLISAALISAVVLGRRVRKGKK
jgi:hypothetical protein